MWENQEQAFKNLGLLRKFSHPNIIRLIGYSALESPVLLVMEYLSGGILLSYLRVESVSISKGKRIQMCKDVASGMTYLHHRRFIHRDLAARNCSVDDKRVKISNFRMTEFGDGYQITKGSNIPVKWTAPEVFLLGKYTFFSDVWSFGILMWEIFSSGELPYEGFTNEEIMEKVTSGYKMSAPKGTPKKCDDLMLSCWKRNPDNRYNFSKIEEKLQEIMKKHQTKHS
ncbi:tyrosine-protein kinase Fer-like [Saccostrea cucullata]|uniref:tyrosine-protein kinase Fer-like n=1 Tax=Saccostrea cuccullata TaxID=36930 RepID=UPI002ED1933C